MQAASRTAGRVASSAGKAAHRVATEATGKPAVRTIEAAREAAGGPAAKKSGLSHGTEPHHRCQRHRGAQLTRFHVLCSMIDRSRLRPSLSKTTAGPGFFPGAGLLLAPCLHYVRCYAQPFRYHSQPVGRIAATDSHMDRL